MNMKKIGSALTALAMVASMATYVPMASVHAHVDMPVKTDYNGWDSANNSWNDSDPLVSTGEREEDYNSDLAAYNAIKVATYTGTVGETKWTLEVSKMLDESSVETGKKATLTIEAKTADAEYTIPTSEVDGEDYFYEIWYEIMDKTSETGIATQDDMMELIDVVNIKGFAKEMTDGALAGVTTQTVNLDCVASEEVKDALLTANVVHDWQANTDRQNHVCAGCGSISNAYAAHTFVAASKTAKEHLCECGKSSEDYINADGEETFEGEVNVYQAIHKFDEATHKCTECGIDDATLHKRKIVSTATTHTVQCSVETCGMTLANAEAHSWKAAKTDLSEKDINVDIDSDETLEEDFVIPAEAHYCTVCGYVRGNATADDTTDDGHTYEYIYEAVDVSEDTEDGNADGIVLTKVTSGGLVCECGFVNPNHNTNEKHEFVGANGYHLCKCGETDTVHTYDKYYTGTGLYEVNGQSGFAYDKDTKGIVCDCGAVNTSKHTNCLVGISGDDLASEANEDIVDKTNHKHYCSCGKLIATTDANGKVTETHNYKYSVADEQHKCECGAVKEEHAYNYVKVFFPKVTFSNPVDIESGLGATLVKTNVTLMLAAGANYEASSVTLTPDDAATYGYEIATITEGVDLTDVTEGLVCECGKVTANHTTHDYTTGSFDTTNFAHYCYCGNSSKDVHDYNPSGDNKNKCKYCGVYLEHDHEVVNCVCTICGESVHDYALKNKAHQCQDCGKTVAATANTMNNAAHTFVVNGDKHVCECGLENPDLHEFGTSGAAVHECQTCDFTKHTATGQKTVDDKIVHTCNCGYVYEGTTGCTFEASNDKCATCNTLNPNHKHARTVEELTGKEVCRCGEYTYEHEWSYVDANNHGCSNVLETIVTTDNGVQTAVPTTTVLENDTTTEVVCAKTEAHDFSTEEKDVEKTFCECGFVNPDAIADAVALVTEVGPDVTPLDNMVGSYTTAYLVKLTQDTEALLAYSSNAATLLGDEDAETVVADTEAKQNAFNALVEAFNATVADKENNKAASGITIQYYDGTQEAWGEVQKGTIVYGQVGTEVTVQAKAKAGYLFEGWYDAPKTNANAQKISSDAAYKVVVPDGGKTLYANFKENEKVTIFFNNGITVYSSITYKDGYVVSNRESLDLLKNEVVTLVPTTGEFNDTDKPTFLNFTDRFGNVCELNGGKYEFTVTLANEYTASSYTEPKSVEVNGSTYNRAYVVFKNGAKVLVSRNINATGSVGSSTEKVFNAETIKPNDPSREGKTFLGWADETNPETVVRLKTLTGSCVLVPVFETMKNIKLDVVGGRFALAADAETNAKTGFEYLAEVGLYAEKQNAEGKYFSGWYVGDTCVSQKQGFTYVITGAVTVEAKYDRDSELVLESMYTLTGTRTKTDNGQQAVLTANWAMTDDMKVVETGYVFSMAGATGDTLKVENVDGSIVRKKTTGLTNQSGVFAYTMNLTSATAQAATITAKAYVTYTDASGAQVTVYSDMVTLAPAN